MSRDLFINAYPSAAMPVSSWRSCGQTERKNHGRAMFVQNVLVPALAGGAQA